MSADYSVVFCPNVIHPERPEPPCKDDKDDKEDSSASEHDIEDSPASPTDLKRKLVDKSESAKKKLHKIKRKQVSVTIHSRDRMWAVELMKQFGQRTIVWQNSPKHSQKRGNSKGLGDGKEYPSGEGIFNVLRETREIISMKSELERENERLKYENNSLRMQLRMFEEHAAASSFRSAPSHPPHPHMVHERSRSMRMERVPISDSPEMERVPLKSTYRSLDGFMEHPLPRHMPQMEPPAYYERMPPAPPAMERPPMYERPAEPSMPMEGRMSGSQRASGIRPAWMDRVACERTMSPMESIAEACEGLAKEPNEEYLKQELQNLPISSHLHA